MGRVGTIPVGVRWAAVVVALMLGVITLAPRASAATPALGPAHPVIEPSGPPKPSGQRPVTPAAGVVSPWVQMTNLPSGFQPGTMLLQTDGSVLVHQDDTGTWYRLAPDAQGNYADGKWTQIASMPSGYGPLYFASAVLPDGRTIVEGGEYNFGNQVLTKQGAIYNPLTNTWTNVNPPSGWTNIGDAQSVVLANGVFMIGQPCSNCTTGQASASTADAQLNASNLTWKNLAGTGKSDGNDEEGWSLLPNGKVLTVDAFNSPNSELFNPATSSWSTAGNVPRPLSDTSPNYELGPQVVRPNGVVFAIGATAYTDAYNPAVPVWAVGPGLPVIGGVQYDVADGPASILPSGGVLFDASPGVYKAPVHFFVYNGSTLTQVPDAPNAPNDSTYNTRMLALPNGQVLFDDGGVMAVYTAGGTPASSWRPTVTSVARTLQPGRTYSLSGTQLNGLSDGAAYGDDVQDNTNYPLVRITDNATGMVTYARTFGMSSASIAAGAASSTQFTLPPGTPLGASSLTVAANGIPSSPLPVTLATVTVTNPGAQTGVVGKPVSLQIKASDTDGGALSYSASGLPPGLSIAPSTGEITGTPTQAGVFKVSVTAKDATGPSFSTAFTWTIS